MEQHEISQIIVRYLGKHYKSLKSAMPDEKYFLIKGATISEYNRGDSRFAIGTAIDILADTIEKEEYFGWYVTKCVEQATNPNNAELTPLKIGDKITGTFEVKLLEDGLQVTVDKVEPKPYLDLIKTPQGFIHAASFLGIEGDLEQIASDLYSS